MDFRPDKDRTDWKPGDKISFPFGFKILSGVITSVHPDEHLADVKVGSGIEYSCTFKEMKLDER